MSKRIIAASFLLLGGVRAQEDGFGLTSFCPDATVTTSWNVYGSCTNSVSSEIYATCDGKEESSSYCQCYFNSAMIEPCLSLICPPSVVEVLGDVNPCVPPGGTAPSSPTPTPLDFTTTTDETESTPAETGTGDTDETGELEDEATTTVDAGGSEETTESGNWAGVVTPGVGVVAGVVGVVGLVGVV